MHNAEHEADSDRELYEYVKAEKRRLGKGMKSAKTTGYCYLIRRLGPWEEFISRINQELREERDPASSAFASKENRKETVHGEQQHAGRKQKFASE